MASNFFGQLFRITTFGESHGKAIGVVIDGCPAGLKITESEVNQELAHRQPGKSPYTSPRGESDQAEILSGVFRGETTGAPISILIWNKDADSSKYESIKNLLRPGHANFTYLQKYGIFDYRGGGRSSARETAARVAAGAIAKKLLAFFKIEICAFVAEIGGIAIREPHFDSLVKLKKKVLANPIFCPDEKQAEKMMKAILEAKEEGDSLGGILQAAVMNLPPGLGDPVYAKLEALLASAMLSLPATKGFEIGSGFAAARMKGSEHNDAFDIDEKGCITTKTNCAGGLLGGISTGLPLTFRVAFKPTSSIKKTQNTVNIKGEKKSFKLPKGSRHDPCVAIRAVPIIEAMTACVLADALLMKRSNKL
ncbi:MAG: chorismate synthase [Chlamydiae bacterium RIFCSPHIGHO2_12_FULL_44_59]|nr:MAG: chorismate synthase [Chlamydiae bacterium RIFCSPHIGHO2_01_FULL_44_39]OGN59115.1 MAG: chorismate synthase [Chlamydiae bacterium RIFCSPHIGHO2_02_FULL_45_9]OGN61126.1 MAG: chorismate synthase [Chlamydiae bacterium RIFCSPHIGHO2_12_FULL_44_59]OGN65596.1 MAG: chorismate synthase [Chlamydiae bacterium RIFCSPLOWO2_01_FULL_44_52]OGN68073.1 MAG: chorismate synthase [Chlamydiae bacterium RIFCSPLOWO2_02_FULL_45_22]OGN68962.1 MAG: chorismate synthase [Chlamydiae bacterium RIFCSPLOWO2_12_FULL_45_20]